MLAGKGGGLTLGFALCAGLGLLLTANGNDPGGRSDAGVSVATAGELLAAVAEGARHILITQHLDLRDAPVQVNSDGGMVVAIVQESTRSIRGHCTEEPPVGLVASTATASLLPRRPGQCLLVYQARILDIGVLDEGSDDAPQQIWLHNLYFRRDGGADVVWSSISVKGIGAEAWLSDVTVQGDGRTDRDTYGLYIGPLAGGAYAERCTFADLYREYTASAIWNRGGTLAVVDTAFRGNVISSFDGAVIVVGDDIPVKGVSLLLENATFADNTGWDVSMQDGVVPVYSDAATALRVFTFSSGKELPGHARPLSAAPPGTFLVPDDPWLLTTQAEACQGEYMTWSGAGDTVTAPCLNVAGLDTLPEAPAPALTTLDPSTSPLPSDPLPTPDSPSPAASSTAPAVPAAGAGGGADTGAVVGGAVAGVAAVAAAVAAVLVALARRRRRAARGAAEFQYPGKADSRHAPPNVTASSEPRVPVSAPPAPRPGFQGQAAVEPPPPYAPWPPQAAQSTFTNSSRVLGPPVGPLPSDPSKPSSREIKPPTTHASSESTLLIASTAAVSSMPTIVADGLEKLEDALDTTRRAGALLCGRYEVLAATDRRVGGQGCVQFVFDRQARIECAVKFFFARRHFGHERALYADTALRSAMAATREVCANDDGAIKAANGAILPPFIVLERGESLDEFQRLQRPAVGAQQDGRIDIVTVAQAMVHTAACVAYLHRLGWVHRDLKPGNVLRVPRSHTWTLIDFGSAAQIGKQAPIEFTPAYAAPEVVRAYMARLPTVVASPAMDVWALGLIAYELLTGERPFRLGAPNKEIFEVLSGQGRLPWEGADIDSAAAARLAKLGMFKRGILQCLERNPAQRPALASVIASWQHVFTATTTAAPRISSAQTVT